MATEDESTNYTLNSKESYHFIWNKTCQTRVNVVLIWSILNLQASIFTLYIAVIYYPVYYIFEWHIKSSDSKIRTHFDNKVANQKFMIVYVQHRNVSKTYDWLTMLNVLLEWNFSVWEHAKRGHLMWKIWGPICIKYKTFNNNIPSMF